VDLAISLDGRGEKTVRVYRALREAIVDGRLPAGHRLPATRTLAADLGVARNSVATAYERLAAYAHDSAGQAGFVFGFGALDPAALDEGLARFGNLLRRTAKL
jgi:DNA-binding transcriptional MocR family regulator